MILNDANFCNYINNSFVFENKPRVAIAVSGGPDSMALLHLVNNCLSNYSYDIAKLVFYLYKNEYVCG